MGDNEMLRYAREYSKDSFITGIFDFRDLDLDDNEMSEGFEMRPTSDTSMPKRMIR